MLLWVRKNHFWSSFYFRDVNSLPYIKWGASSWWSSSIYWPMPHGPCEKRAKWLIPCYHTVLYESYYVSWNATIRWLSDKSTVRYSALKIIWVVNIRIDFIPFVGRQENWRIFNNTRNRSFSSKVRLQSPKKTSFGKILVDSDKFRYADPGRYTVDLIVVHVS